MENVAELLEMTKQNYHSDGKSRIGDIQCKFIAVYPNTAGRNREDFYGDKGYFSGPVDGLDKVKLALDEVDDNGSYAVDNSGGHTLGKVA